MKLLPLLAALATAFDHNSHYLRTNGVLTNNRRSMKIAQAIKRARFEQIKKRVLQQCAIGNQNACVVAKLICP